MFSAISASTFRWRAFYSFLIMLLGTLGFPFILYVIIKNSDCQGIGGACGAVAAVVGTTLKPWILRIAGLLYLLNTFKRTKMIVSRAWVLFAMALLLSLAPLLFVIGNYWAASFSYGILVMPRSEFLKLLPLITLTVLLSMDLEENPRMQNGISGVKGPGIFPLGTVYCIIAALFTGIVILSFAMVYLPFNFILSPAGLAIYSILNLATTSLAVANAVAGMGLLYSLLRIGSTPTPGSQKSAISNRNQAKPMFGSRKA